MDHPFLNLRKVDGDTFEMTKLDKPTYYTDLKNLNEVALASGSVEGQKNRKLNSPRVERLEKEYKDRSIMIFNT